MIEVNLLPGSTKGKKAATKRRASGPALGGLGGDRWVLGAGAVVLLALVVVGWLWLSVAGQAEDLRVEIEMAQRDSARFADVIRRTEALQARRDTIVQQVMVLQEIDGARYVWPHLMDEVGRALPNFTWLIRMQQVSSPPNLTFRVRGRASNYFALTTFMENLEASPFVRGVRLVTSDQVVMTVPGAGSRNVYEFELEAAWQDPPAGVIQREPLFGPSVALPGLEDEPLEPAPGLSDEEGN